MRREIDALYILCESVEIDHDQAVKNWQDKWTKIYNDKFVNLVKKNINFNKLEKIK
jgi:hypothetical protein